MCDWVRGVIIDCIHLVNVKCRLMHRKNMPKSLKALIQRHPTFILLHLLTGVTSFA